jgi:hypothetical protein
MEFHAARAGGHRDGGAAYRATEERSGCGLAPGWWTPGLSGFGRWWLVVVCEFVLYWAGHAEG